MAKLQPYQDPATGLWVCPRCGRADFKSPQQVYGHWRFCKSPMYAWQQYQKAVSQVPATPAAAPVMVPPVSFENLAKRVEELEKVVYNELTHLKQQYEQQKSVEWEKIAIWVVLGLLALAFLDRIGGSPAAGPVSGFVTSFAKTAGSQLAKKI